MSDKDIKDIKDLPLLKRAKIMLEDRDYRYRLDTGYFWNLAEELLEWAEKAELQHAKSMDYVMDTWDEKLGVEQKRREALKQAVNDYREWYEMDNINIPALDDAAERMFVLAEEGDRE